MISNPPSELTYSLFAWERLLEQVYGISRQGSVESVFQGISDLRLPETYKMQIMNQRLLWYIHKNKEFPTNCIQISYYIKHLIKHFQSELVEVRNIIREKFQMNGGVFPLALCTWYHLWKWHPTHCQISGRNELHFMLKQCISNFLPD